LRFSLDGAAYLIDALPGYVSSIYVLVPQFEGVVKDYLRECGLAPADKFPECVEQLGKMVFGRKVLVSPRGVLEKILEYLQHGHFWKHSGKIGNPSDAVNRHGILHGVFTDFESESISLKYLILFEGLSFLLLHDRCIRGAL